MKYYLEKNNITINKIFIQYCDERIWKEHDDGTFCDIAVKIDNEWSKLEPDYDNISFIVNKEKLLIILAWYGSELEEVDDSFVFEKLL